MYIGKPKIIVDAGHFVDVLISWELLEVVKRKSNIYFLFFMRH